MIYFAVDDGRLHLLEYYLAREWGRPLRERMRQVSYAELFRSRSLARGAWIFSGLEALTGAELRMVDQIQRAARDAGLRVLNPALEVLSRYDLLRLLHETGRNSFRAVRADEGADSLRYPVFVREADEHNGSLTPLLHDRAALNRALAYLWMRGMPRRQLLIVEFCETADAEGLYRKYSVFRIGDCYIARYLHVGTEWMTKSYTSRVDERTVREEMDYLRADPHAAWAREMFELAHIEYGRLDYGVQQGRPQAWEINSAPVLTGVPYRTGEIADPDRIRALTKPAHEYAHVRMRAAFERLDPGPLDGGEVGYEFARELVEEARRERREAERVKRWQRRIDRWAAAPGLRAIGPRLRRLLRG